MSSRFPQHTSFKLYASQLNRARFFKMLSVERCHMISSLRGYGNIL